MKLDDFRVDYFRDDEFIEVQSIWLQDKLQIIDEQNRLLEEYIMTERLLKGRVNTLELSLTLSENKRIRLDVVI